MGGRVRMMLTAAAPISPEVKNFFRLAVGCPMVEAYGQTEITGGCHITDFSDPSNGHVGGVLGTCEYRLEDVKEMQYYAYNPTRNMEQHGDSRPRGEVLVRGPQVIPAYLKNPKKTSETIDSDGWLHTGDIGMILESGALKIIDRKKNIMKIANGEYVAPEKVEIVYNTHHMIAEVFIDAKSTEEYVVGFFVPEQEALDKFAEENGFSGSVAELAQNE